MTKQSNLGSTIKLEAYSIIPKYKRSIKGGDSDIIYPNEDAYSKDFQHNEIIKTNDTNLSMVLDPR